MCKSKSTKGCSQVRVKCIGKSALGRIDMESSGL